MPNGKVTHSSDDCGDSCCNGDCGVACCGGDQGGTATAPEANLAELRREIERLRERVDKLETSGRAHAARRICALMTEITTLETDVLQRGVTTSELKKAGMKALGVE